MRDFIANLFKENGDVSSIRVMSMISLLIGGYIAIQGLHSDKPLNDVAILCGVFVGAAFTGKVMQKAVELKQKKDE